jgi:hypothetical protein
MLVQIPDDLLDAILVRDRLVEAEFDLRRAPEAQALADLPPHERRGALKRARGVLLRSVIAQAGVEDAGELEIGSHGHARQRDESDPRVVDLASQQHLAELLANLIADTVRTMRHVHW